MLEVYAWEPNADCGQPLLCLNEKGVDFTFHYVDIGKREHQRADYLKINPNGAVPTVVHDGFVMTEASPALEYIDAAFAGPMLRPEDPYLRWRMRKWIRHVDFELCPALAMVAGFGASQRLTERQGDESIRRIEAGIRLFEQTLREDDYLAGPEYSLADIVAMVSVYALPISRPDSVNDQKAPALMDWLRRCHERPAVQATFNLSRGRVKERAAEARRAVGVGDIIEGAANDA